MDEPDKTWDSDEKTHEQLLEWSKSDLGRQVGCCQVIRLITVVSGDPKWGGIIWAKASNVLAMGCPVVFHLGKGNKGSQDKE